MKHHESEEVFLLKKTFENKINAVILLLILGAIGGYLLHDSYHTCPVSVESNKVEVCFTPGSPCEDKIIQKINTAQKEILLQAFAFTSKPIEKALLRAKRRGVSIKVLSDRGRFQNKYARLPALKKKGIPVYFDKQPSYAHNKVMIIDSALTITGSYNWTYSAQNRNSENVIFLESPEVSHKYRQNFHALLGNTT